MPEMEPSAIDQRIMDLAATGFSPEEIAENLGVRLTADEIRNRFKFLNRSRNWLTLLEQQWLLLAELRGLIASYRPFAKDGHLKSGDLVIRAVSESRKMIDAMRTDSQANILQINQHQAELLGKVLVGAVEQMVRRFGLPEEQVNEVLLEVVPQAIHQIEEAANPLNEDAA